MISRCSRAEWSGSSKIRAGGFANTVSAYSMPTRCFLALASAFTASHSKSTRIATNHEGITMQSAVQRIQHGSNDWSAVPLDELTRGRSQPAEPDRRQPSAAISQLRQIPIHRRLGRCTLLFQLSQFLHCLRDIDALLFLRGIHVAADIEIPVVPLDLVKRNDPARTSPRRRRRGTSWRYSRCPGRARGSDCSPPRTPRTRR